MDTELSSLLKDIFLGVSAIVVAVVGVIGLTTWKSQLKGKAMFDVARTIMRSAFALRKDFESARFPLSLSVESADRIKRPDESEGESRALDEWHIRRKRLRPLTEHLDELQEAGWEAEATLDADASGKVSESIVGLRQSYGDLVSAIDALCEERLDTAAGKTVPPNRDNYIRDLSKIIYSRSGDDLSKRINKHVDSLASTLKRYVR